MALKKMHVVPFRRKREGRTNYKKRLQLLVSGKARVVIRKSLDNIMAQIVEYNQVGDKILLSCHSNELKKFGWNSSKSNLPAAYLVGLLLGIKAKEKKITEGVLDICLNPSTRGSRIYAVVKGLIDAGFSVHCSKDILPTDERVSGKHIVEYASKLKRKNKELFDRQFSIYTKNNIDPEKFTEYFDAVKKKVVEGRK
jgi:large subunit ribosomal protein L18